MKMKSFQSLLSISKSIIFASCAIYSFISVVIYLLGISFVVYLLLLLADEQISVIDSIIDGMDLSNVQK